MTMERKSGFDEFFRAFFNPACLFIGRVLKRSDDVSDMAQEVFMRLYERWEEFKTTDNAKAFLYVSARNLCMDQLKRQKAAENYLDYSRQQDEAEESFLGEVIREETYRILYAAIDKLPWQTRQIVLMCMDGDSNNEVAEKLGISVNTVKTLKKNGYATLRQLLANEYVIFLFFLLEQL